MEIGLRCLLGGLFVMLLVPLAYTLGSSLWEWLGLVLGLFALPIAFFTGFFWVEIKLALWLFGKLIFGIFG